MASKLRTVNLEEGMPLVDEAVRHLTRELHYSRKSGVTVLKIIHGYGSTGVGGRIRVGARRYLDGLASRGEIKCYIPGETFSIFDENTRQAFLVCGELRKEHDLDRHNNGVTFIVL